MGFTSNRKAFIASVKDKLTYALESEGERSMGEVRESLSIDYPPSSSAGSPPHRRTGNLQNGVEQQVEVQSQAVELIVFSNRVEDDPRVPEWLEFGSAFVRERPYMGPAFLRTRERLGENLVKALKV